MLRYWFAAVLGFWAMTAQSAGMGYDEARHLLARTGFAPAEREVQAYARLSRTQAVDKLLSETRTTAQTPAPSWADEAIQRPRELRDASEDERKRLLREALERGFELRGWWYREMWSTPTPLTERMTLFWHNHFVSSQQKVKAPQLMYRQNLLLRQHALGNFGELLHAIAKDPAMVIYLDSASNRKGQPNENFAREVMELFTLGTGHYTEQDIKEAARAFTGWSLNRSDFSFRNYRLLHDGGEKTVLGQRGDFDGDAVLDILLAQPATAEFITAKLWREFVSPTPDAREVKRLAQVFRIARYEIKPLLRALLTTDAFYAPAHRGTLIKSPVELLVGTVRQFGIEQVEPRLLALSGRQLGQDIFNPPNVKGWPGGEDWINSNTLLARKQIMEHVFRGEEMPLDPRMAREQFGQGAALALGAQRALNTLHFDVTRFYDAFAGDEAAKRTRIARLVLPLPVAEAGKPNGDRLDFIRQLTLDPVYQLK